MTAAVPTVVRARAVLAWVGAYLVLAVAVGALTGALWWRVVDLPGYRVGADGGAATTERGLTQFIGGDAWFSLLGLVVSIGLGLVAWRWFRALGAVVVPVVLVATVAAALACWAVGYRLGPGPFDPRLAAAHPGDVVPIALTVRARVAVLVWPFGGVLPVLLAAALGPDEDEPHPRRTG